VRRNNRRYNSRQSNRYQPKSNSRRVAHVSVYANAGEHPEKTIRRFLKKCKKEKIVEQYKKNEYFEKPSVKKHRAKLKRKAAVQKVNKEIANKR